MGYKAYVVFIALCCCSYVMVERVKEYILGHVFFNLLFCGVFPPSRFTQLIKQKEISVSLSWLAIMFLSNWNLTHADLHNKSKFVGS